MRRLMAVLLMGMAFGQPAFAASGAPEWVAWTGKLPKNIVQGGTDFHGTDILYICRGYYVNGTHPGKLLRGDCRIGHGGKEIVLKSKFEVMVWKAAPPQPSGSCLH